MQLITGLDAGEAAAGVLEAKLTIGLADRLDAIQATADSIYSQLAGSVGTRLDALQDRSAKIVNKLARLRQRQLDNAYSHAVQLGGHWPTLEAALSGLETGDVIGTMGVPRAVLPISDEPPPTTLPGGTGPPPPVPSPVPGSTPPPPIGPPGQQPPPGIVPGPLPGQRPPPGQGPPPGVLPPQPGGIFPPPVQQPPPGVIPPIYPPGTDCAALGFQPYPYAGPGGQLIPVPGVLGLIQGMPMPTDPGCWIPVYYCGTWCDNKVWWTGENSTNYYDIYGHGRCLYIWIGNWVMTSADPADCALPPGQQPPPGTQPPPACTPPPPPVCAGPDGDICFVSLPPTCGPKAAPEFPQLGIEGDDACEAYQKGLEAIGGAEADFTKWFGMMSDKGDITGIGAVISKVILGRKTSIVPDLVNRFTTWVSKTAEAVSTKSGCLVPEAAPVIVYRSLCNFVNKYVGVIPPELDRILTQIVNFACQTMMPSGDEADAAYLADKITKDVWECWHKVQGDKLNEAKAVMESSRTRPDWRAAIELHRRKMIDDSRFTDLMRQAGVLGTEDRDNLEKSQQAWPPFTDVIRFMLRDVADEVNVDWRKADELFEQKYKDLVEMYGEGQGITRELAKQYWRAHFQIPSYTMGADWVHRFREGAVDPEIVFTKEDFRQMLIQDDWSPQYIDRMIAATFRPITRIDSRRMYTLHAIDEAKLTGYLEDVGYNHQAALDLTEYFRVNRDVAEAKASGYPTARTLINQYAKGEATYGQLGEVIMKIAVGDDQRQAMLDAAEFAKETYGRSVRIKGLRWQYLRCLIDDATAQSALAEIGVDPEEVTDLVDQWRLIRQCRTKEMSAATLCKMRGHGIVTPGEQMAALLRAGWTREAAVRIVAECTWELGEAEQKRVEKAARQAAADEAKRKKDAAKCPPKPCKNGQPAIPA